jgi:TetR/AcrR family transcriptional regulator, transcriptional repressor for nem operon
MTDTKTRLLDKAAEHVQTRGFNGFSFHDLADAIGIRTASIHYHFPTKLALGQALIDRYNTDFMKALGEPTDGKPEERLQHYVGMFRRTLAQKRMCLCGMIGAEAAGLPKQLSSGVSLFFVLNEKWLTDVYARMGLTKAGAKSRALLTFAALEGAMIMSRNDDSSDHFEKVAKAVQQL